MVSNTDVNDTVGMNIRRLRKERGMTQGKLAEKAGIQRETISKYESNKLTPPPYNLESIEKALQVPAGTLAQKVAIAMTIMDDPKILILDEPLNAIDDISVKKIREIIMGYKQRDKIVLIASHYKDDIDYLCDEVYEMRKGEIVEI